MTLAARFALAGALWGALLGAGAALAVVALAAGVGWLVLFGDDPWPAGAERIILALGALAFLAASAGGTALGWLYGRGMDGAPPEVRRRAARLCTGLLATAPVLAALVLAWEWQGGLRTRGALVQGDAEQAYFQGLKSDRQRIVESHASAPAADGRVTLRLTLSGARTGPHRLRWRAAVGGYKVEIEGARRIDLTAGDNRIDLAIPAHAIGLRFRDVAMSDARADAAADLSVGVSIWLTPELTADERARVPAYEVQNLKGGGSALIDHYATSLALSYEFRGGEVFVRP